LYPDAWIIVGCITAAFFIEIVSELLRRRLYFGGKHVVRSATEEWQKPNAPAEGTTESPEGFCPHCGFGIRGEYAFCPRCGKGGSLAKRLRPFFDAASRYYERIDQGRRHLGFFTFASCPWGDLVLSVMRICHAIRIYRQNRKREANAAISGGG
jgi:ribosomal protein S27AE